MEFLVGCIQTTIGTVMYTLFRFHIYLQYDEPRLQSQEKNTKFKFLIDFIFHS